MTRLQKGQQYFQVEEITPKNRVFNALSVSSQNVGAYPCGRPVGRHKALPLPRIIEKILYDQ